MRSGIDRDCSTLHGGRGIDRDNRDFGHIGERLASAAEPLPVKAPSSSNVVVEWNRTLLSLVVTPGALPATIQPTRDFAIVSVAVLDGVRVASARTPAADPALTRVQDAAAPQAAHDVLTATFPTFAASLNQQLALDLAAIPMLPRSEGVQAGADAAAAVLQARAGDGSAAIPPAYQTTGLPSDYRPTPPAFATAVFTGWATVTPFLMRRADEFRPAPPPLWSPCVRGRAERGEKRGSEDQQDADA